jgi:hypothetical protein
VLQRAVLLLNGTLLVLFKGAWVRFAPRAVWCTHLDLDPFVELPKVPLPDPIVSEGVSDKVACHRSKVPDGRTVVDVGNFGERKISCLYRPDAPVETENVVCAVPTHQS